jgi:integrase
MVQSRMSEKQSQKVLDNCPDAEWRLIFALARYGGLRIPSELLSVRWADVNLPAGRMTIHSPKTEHHTGKASRVVPIFSELCPYLEDCDALAEPGTEFVINRYRQKNANLRTQLERIIERAGLTPWPKLFQNLRATRATELADEYPEHVAAEWMGHSRKVARKHYWHVTDAHFAKAAKPHVAVALDGGTNGGTVAAQTVAPTGHDSETTRRDTEGETPENCRELAEAGVSCASYSVTPTGLEPVLPP